MTICAPIETYHALEKYAVKKTHLRWDQLWLQAFMAGVYISLGCHVSLSFAGAITSPNPVNGTPTPPPYSIQKFMLSALFPMGLIAVLTTGAELFTSNSMTMLTGALAKKTTWFDLVKVWTVSWWGNLIGSIFTMYFLGYLTNVFSSNTDILHYVLHVSEAKAHLDPGVAVLRGIGCNILVCIAVWQALACNDGAGKVLLVWLPVSSFIVCGFEHCVANMYFIPMGMALGADITWYQFICNNLLPVTVGNILGGAGLVGAVYWYEFHPRQESPVAGMTDQELVEVLQDRIEKNASRLSFASLPNTKAKAAQVANLTKNLDEQVQTYSRMSFNSAIQRHGITVQPAQDVGVCAGGVCAGGVGEKDKFSPVNTPPNIPSTPPPNGGGRVNTLMLPSKERTLPRYIEMPNVRERTNSVPDARMFGAGTQSHITEKDMRKSSVDSTAQDAHTHTHTPHIQDTQRNGTGHGVSLVNTNTLRDIACDFDQSEIDVEGGERAPRKL